MLAIILELCLVHRPLTLTTFFFVGVINSTWSNGSKKDSYRCLVPESKSRSWSSLVFWNFHFQFKKLKSVFHYFSTIFGTFTLKAKSRSWVPVSVLVPEPKSRSLSSLVFKTSTSNLKAEMVFPIYLFWNFHSQDEKQKCWISFWNMNRIAKSTSNGQWSSTSTFYLEWMFQDE